MSRIISIHRNMDDCSCAAAASVRNPQFVHEFVVSGSNFMTVNNCHNTVTADFLYLCHPAHIQLFPVCFLQTDTDGMCAVGFRQCSVFQKFFLFFGVQGMPRHSRTAGRIAVLSVNPADFKNTLGNGPGLIKHNRPCLRQCL